MPSETEEVQQDSSDSETGEGSKVVETDQNVEMPTQKRPTRELRNLLDDQEATAQGWDSWRNVLKAREKTESEMGIRDERGVEDFEIKSETDQEKQD